MKKPSSGKCSGRKFVLYVDKGPGDDHYEYADITEEEIKTLSEDELHELLEELAGDFLHNHVEYGWYEGEIE